MTEETPLISKLYLLQKRHYCWQFLSTPGPHYCKLLTLPVQFILVVAVLLPFGLGRCHSYSSSSQKPYVCITVCKMHCGVLLLFRQL
eukprot:jgi/Botrbrau1/3445/Bobra.139_1s0025.1